MELYILKNHKDIALCKITVIETQILPTEIVVYIQYELHSNVKYVMERYVKIELSGHKNFRITRQIQMTA